MMSAPREGGPDPPRAAFRPARWGLIVLPSVLAPLAVFLGSWAGGRILLPILATLAVYPVLALYVLRGRYGAAIAAVLLWAASLSGSIIALSARDPGLAGTIVLNGPEYRDEMFEYVRTGGGRETDPRRFLLQHLIHLVAFVLLTAISGGVLGIALGAVLVGYMSCYVGSLAAAGPVPWLAFTLGWPPWAILRVAAYVMLGAALSRPVLQAVARRRVAPPPAWIWFVACGLLVLDALLKGLLAPAWSALLRPCLGSP